jgi:hypothetical protein
MNNMLPEPTSDNDFLAEHATLLIHSYRLRTGRDLLDPGLAPREAARALYHAEFVVLSHDTAADPLFTYANLAAQARFELRWGQIVGMPSRYSAEPLAWEARARLLETVARQGYIDDYSGVRITKSGRRFLIERATVWNLGGVEYEGQAATFSACRDLDGSDSPA